MTCQLSIRRSDYRLSYNQYNALRLELEPQYRAELGDERMMADHWHQKFVPSKRLLDLEARYEAAKRHAQRVWTLLSDSERAWIRGEHARVLKAHIHTPLTTWAEEFLQNVGGA